MTFSTDGMDERALLIRRDLLTAQIECHKQANQPKSAKGAAANLKAVNAALRKLQKPRVNSRNKGSAFERAIAQELFLQTGITFKRDLEQYRAGEHGDLIASDPNWPFLLELKRYASGNGCKPAWQEQASKAALAAGKWPVVIYKYDRQDVRVSLPLSVAVSASTGPDDMWCDVSLPGFVWLAREYMAEAYHA